MSLINEALKKAQSQRTNPPVTPPGSTPPPPAVTANSSAPSPSPFGKAGVLIAICAVIVSISVLVTVLLLRRPATSSVPDTTQTERIGVANTPPTHTSNGSVALVRSGPANAVVPAPTAATPPVASNAPGSAEPISPGVAAPSTAAAIAFPTLVPTPSPEPTPVKQTVRVQALVDKFRISGIRLSDTDSKVILNDHLFQVDDPVESSLGLRLTKIEAHRLTFVDADGNTYVKRF